MSDLKLLKNIFVNTGAFLGSTFGESKANLVTYLRKVKRRLTNKDELVNYLSTEYLKLIFVAAYVIINLVLFLEASIRWGLLIKGLLGVDSFWVGVARGFGQLLNFNCALLLMPVMRSTMTLLRNFKLFRYVIPMDKSVIFHRYIAYWIVICSFGHGLAHYFNYSCCAYMYLGTLPGDPSSTWWVASYGTKAGLTGNLLVIVMVVLYAASNKTYRKSENYNVFWYSHHLFLPFYVLLMLHCKNFWLWFLGPGAFYLFERLLRNMRGSEHRLLVSAHALPSGVLELKLRQPGFRYHAGQYCYLNVPGVSLREWHPFTISSSPEEQYMTFHVRVVGDWTGALDKLVNPTRAPCVQYDPEDAHSSGLIRIDGPFGTCAESITDYENVWLIAAGIGVTPYAAMLKHLYFLKTTNKLRRIKHVSFQWIVRDESAFEWFCELLNDLETREPGFFDIRTFITGRLSAERVREIFASSDEVAAKLGKAAAKRQQCVARALADYEPVASDEVELHAGDVVTVLDRSDDSWWHGINTRSNRAGHFPSKFVSVTAGVGGSTAHDDDMRKTMRNNRNRRFGRPILEDEFFDYEKRFARRSSSGGNNSGAKNNASCGVFFCGPTALSKHIKKTAARFSAKGNIRFHFHKEVF